MDIWNLIAERKIQEAMEEGAFDHLEGTGRPLPLDDNPYEDPAQRMAHRILRNNGFAPTGIEEAKEIDAELRRLESGRARCSDAEYRRRIAALNHRIEAYNLKTPVALTQRPKIRL